MPLKWGFLARKVAATVARKAVARTVARSEVPSEARCSLACDGTESELETVHPGACDGTILVREVVAEWPAGDPRSGARMGGVGWERSLAAEAWSCPGWIADRR
jgi:hypothetical protein